MQLKEDRRRALIEKAPLLEIKLAEGNAYQQEESVKINAMGLINSKREDCEDHYVYFGSAKDMNGKIVNDVVCSKDDQFADQHFYIRYDKSKIEVLTNSVKNCYYIKDLGLGTGTFIRVHMQTHSVIAFS